MPYSEAWLIVGGTVVVAVLAIAGEYVWRRATGRWPPKGSGSGVAGTSAIIVATQDKDDSDDGGDSSDSGGDSGGGD